MEHPLGSDPIKPPAQPFPALRQFDASFPHPRSRDEKRHYSATLHLWEAPGTRVVCPNRAPDSRQSETVRQRNGSWNIMLRYGKKEANNEKKA